MAKCEVCHDVARPNQNKCLSQDTTQVSAHTSEGPGICKQWTVSLVRGQVHYHPPPCGISMKPNTHGVCILYHLSKVIAFEKIIQSVCSQSPVPDTLPSIHREFYDMKSDQEGTGSPTKGQRPLLWSSY